MLNEKMVSNKAAHNLFNFEPSANSYIPKPAKGYGKVMSRLAQMSLDLLVIY